MTSVLSIHARVVYRADSLRELRDRHALKPGKLAHKPAAGKPVVCGDELHAGQDGAEALAYQREAAGNFCEPAEAVISRSSAGLRMSCGAVFILMTPSDSSVSPSSSEG